MSRTLASFLLAAASLVAVLGWPAVSRAQNPRWVEPPADVPNVQRSDPARNLEFMFEALKAAPDDVSAKAIEDRIWALWHVSGSDTVDLLMGRAKQAIEAKDVDVAMRLLNAIIEIKPDFTEAWDRRATMFFLKKDYANSLADLQHVLAQEPRHFGALAGLGTILEEFGDEKHALEAYRRAMAVHPRLKGIAEHIKTLAEKVEGRDI